MLKINPIVRLVIVMIVSFVLMVAGKWFDIVWLSWMGSALLAGCLVIIGRFIYDCVMIGHALAQDDPTDTFHFDRK